MELDIIRLGAPVGRLSIRDAGLYRQISARIAPAGTLLRLYLDGEAFGVFCPEGDALTLRTRVSRDRLPAPPGLAVAWCPADGGWQPSGEGLIRFTPLGAEAADIQGDGFLLGPEGKDLFLLSVLPLHQGILGFGIQVEKRDDGPGFLAQIDAVQRQTGRGGHRVIPLRIQQHRRAAGGNIKQLHLRRPSLIRANTSGTPR